MRCRCGVRLQHPATGRPRRHCSPACRYRAYRRRKRQPVLFSSRSCEWATPVDLFAELDAEHGPFTLDVSATPANAKCPRFYTRAEDGLRQPWTGKVWCNPPYGRELGRWVKKALESVRSGSALVVVCLLPARVDTRWWHEVAALAEVRFLRGRLRFGGAASGAPFPSAVVVFRGAPGVSGAPRNSPELGLVG
jgi:site-specific DNA-methyltransferase (adenine-specific)